MSIHQMRIDEPFGDTQRQGLWLYQVIEPKLWAKMTLRVAGAAVTPPTLGAMALLEWIDARAVASPATADHLDCVRARWILARGRECAELALAAGCPGAKSARFGRDAEYSPLDWAALRWASGATDGHLLTPGMLAPAFEAAFAGWRMIPAQGHGGGSEYLFGPESIAGVLLLAEPLHATPEALLWNVPLCLLGHLAALKGHMAHMIQGIESRGREITKQERSRIRTQAERALHHISCLRLREQRAVAICASLHRLMRQVALQQSGCELTPLVGY
jgi:hypothetical protein